MRNVSQSRKSAASRLSMQLASHGVVYRSGLTSAGSAETLELMAEA
jgi:hypothetical protein